MQLKYDGKVTRSTDEKIKAMVAALPEEEKVCDGFMNKRNYVIII